MNKTELTDSLLNWYEINQRNLPWRKNKDPYLVWVSEIMLQQTRVETVCPYFDTFMKKFPTIASLAQADEQDLIKQWEGLGFYRRVFNIQKAAKKICMDYDGTFPVNYEDLLRLPGIGEYTAAAVSSIAYEQKYPAMDGNVMRIIARLFAIRENILKAKTKKVLISLLSSIFPDKRFGDFNQAMMELGSLICVPRKPNCEKCPIRTNCKAYLMQLQNEIPLRKSNIEKRKIRRYHFLCFYQNEIMVNKRPEQGLLANLWEFPGVEAENKKTARETFFQKYDIQLSGMKYLFNYQHIFSHRIWQIRVYRVDISNKVETAFFLSSNELLKLALPSAYKKMRDFVIITNDFKRKR